MSKYYSVKKSGNPKKNKAWKWFSKYIRLRDALKTTGTLTYAVCITCGDIHPVEEMDSGHALPGRYNSILFEEELVHAQCRKCNRHGGGELEAYKIKLIEMFGSSDRYDYWMAHKKDHVEYTNFDYEQIAKIYRRKVKYLLDEKQREWDN